VTRETVERCFPLADIEADDLREGVAAAWTSAVEETGVDLETVPWFPPVQRALGIDDESLVDHVIDVYELADGMAETLNRRRGTPDVDVDLVRTGALVHDVSKLYEYEEGEETVVGDLLGHPHYGVHVVARAGLPAEVQHVVLSHTRRTSVDPATLEAVVVRRADEVAAAAIRATAVDDLRSA
jgi:putative nucleotidyltransferase with HDIG domain